jgi:hypothetical protein
MELRVREDWSGKSVQGRTINQTEKVIQRKSSRDKW